MTYDYENIKFNLLLVQIFLKSTSHAFMTYELVYLNYNVARSQIKILKY